jgi:hypothetical protein
MSTTSLFAEFMVIGLVPFLALFFWALYALQIHDLSVLSWAKDFSGIMLLLVTLIIYFLGVILHRVNQLLGLVRIWFLRLPPIRRRNKSTPAGWTEYYVQQAYRQAYIYQHGSDRLVAQIEYGKSLARIYRSMTLSLPFLGVALWLWLRVTVGAEAGVASLVICLAFSGLAAVCYLLERKNQAGMAQASMNLLQQEMDGRAKQPTAVGAMEQAVSGGTPGCSESTG